MIYTVEVSLDDEEFYLAEYDSDLNVYYWTFWSQGMEKEPDRKQFGTLVQLIIFAKDNERHNDSK
ncbi:MAG: hypothetical protein ACRDEA_15295 [Microcystaceae cyanobacterium]